MSQPVVITEFDAEKASTYRPNQEFVKTAVLVDVADDSATTVLNTPFGSQRMQGPFYIVAEDDQSYGAAKFEFDIAHVSVGPNQWTKVEPIDAYRADEICSVTTTLGGHDETTVVAHPGDWIVQQPTGEIVVISPEVFEYRYLVNEPSEDRHPQ